ncbi:hypothetical protein JMN32_15320 [Fulvivirga sp. 29W222]|uniref:Uncharacterized protein n=1 Tax=Fulvivirga marina TaxID=2494733 RepID=A0A937FZG2_9BACT|nr:hypothetical protein [Fulvivirga marina]MBL6447687.1 hypothetical protein [Fulvivirga marina]
MKNVRNLFRICAIVAAFFLTSCEDQFVEEPKTTLVDLPAPNGEIRGSKDAREITDQLYLEFFECTYFNGSFLAPKPWVMGDVLWLDDDKTPFPQKDVVPWYLDNATIYAYRKLQSDPYPTQKSLRVGTGGYAYMNFLRPGNSLGLYVNLAKDVVNDGKMQQFSIYAFYNDAWHLAKSGIMIDSHNPTNITVDNIDAGTGQPISVALVLDPDNTMPLDFSSFYLEVL